MAEAGLDVGGAGETLRPSSSIPSSEGGALRRSTLGRGGSISSSASLAAAAASLAGRPRPPLVAPDDELPVQFSAARARLRSR